ncbi:MAG: DUF6051 family protein [Bacteroidales bacterium]|nr:DUF6051 family protein [Bacteroidales bacterium]
MTYFEDHLKLAKSYNTNQEVVPFDDEGMVITNQPFYSRFFDMFRITDNKAAKGGVEYALLHDKGIRENREFSYPVFKKTTNSDDSKVIILLHGLNERSWDKYLPWGKALCLRTGHPVILFPISFHINRSPVLWSNPRKMTALVKDRAERTPSLKEATFVNAAISNRLDECPQRFFLSGLETYTNLLDLFEQLQNGKHPLFSNPPVINFFGYSIGALLTEIVLLADREGKLAGSNIFLFCGGTTLDKMNGVSRFIIDSKAFKTVQDFFADVDFRLNHAVKMKEKIDLNPVEDAFNAMMNSRKLVAYRKSGLSSLSRRLMVCPLKKDVVIPAKAVEETFAEVFDGKPGKVVQAMDFPFEYSHVTPFPCRKEDSDVNHAFDQVFRKAAAFLQ